MQSGTPGSRLSETGVYARSIQIGHVLAMPSASTCSSRISSPSRVAVTVHVWPIGRAVIVTTTRESPFGLPLPTSPRTHQ